MSGPSKILRKPTEDNEALYIYKLYVYLYVFLAREMDFTPHSQQVAKSLICQRLFSRCRQCAAVLKMPMPQVGRRGAASASDNFD